MAFSGFQNNGVEITGGNCYFSYDPMLSGSYNSAGLPGTSTNTLGVSIGFNGTNQSLSYNPTFLNGTTTSLTFGTNSFTVESWVFITKYPAGQATILDANNSFGNGDAFTLTIDNEGSVNAWFKTIFAITTTKVALNSWTHIAYVRNSANSNTYNIYINGVSALSGTDSNNYSYTPSTAYIGVDAGQTQWFAGQLTNLRVSNGSAVYTSNFTPPNQPLTSAGSSLCLLALTSAGFLTDSSPSNYTMTNNGSITSNTNTPFQATPGSMYLDGASYIYANATASGNAFAFGTNEFTTEYWVYTTAGATGSAQHMTDYRNTSTTTAYADYIGVDGNIVVEYDTSGGTVNNVVVANVPINNNAWNHVAWGRTTGGNVNIWINGVLAGTAVAPAISQPSTSLAIGSQNPGIAVAFQPKAFISQLRVSNSQVYTSNNFGAPAYLGTTANTVCLLNTYTRGTVMSDASVNNIQFSAAGNIVFGGGNYGPFANVIGDLSGRQNTGLLSYAANTAAPIWYSNKNGYWALTGGTTNQQYITTSIPQVNPTADVAGGGTGGQTIGMWIQTSTASNAAPLASFIDSKLGNNSGGNFGPMMFINGGNGVSYSQFDGGAGSGKIASGTGNVNDGNWHYVVGTTTAPGNLSLYIDGNLASAVSFTSGGTWTGYWRFGGNPPNAGGSPWGIPGAAANSYTPVNFGPIHSYNTALTANQIYQNYNMVKARFTNTGTANYSYTGDVQSFQVPAGVTLVNATITGAAGGKPISSFGNVGDASGTTGGAGAVISGTIPVNPGQILTLVVGRGGQDYSYYNTSANGNVFIGGPGGAGSTNASNTQIYGGNGGAGGGFTGIFNSADVSQFSAIMIAGGGGGGSGWNGYNASGGNAASGIANVASPGLNNPSPLASWGGAPIANISGNGTVVTVKFSATITGNVNGSTVPFTPYFQGQPVSLYGATSPFSGKTGYVLTASPTQITYYSTDTGSQSPTSAYVYSQGLDAGSGAAPNYPGGFGYIYDYGVNNTWGSGGASTGLVGGVGSTTFNPAWTGGGGGGGGYFGGGGGSSGGAAVGGGGGGSNYVNPIVQSATFLSLTGVNSNLTAQHGSIRLSW